MSEGFYTYQAVNVIGLSSAQTNLFSFRVKPVVEESTFISLIISVSQADSIKDFCSINGLKPHPTPSNFIAGRHNAALLFCLLLVVFFFIFSWLRFIVVLSIVSLCLVCDSSIVATCPSIPAVRFAFCLCLIRFVFVDVVVFLVNRSGTKGEGWWTAN